MSEREGDVYRIHSEGVRQYMYFLLAADAAAIGFAVNQTRDARLELWHVPLVIAVVLWGSSFYLGCRNLQSVHSGLFASAEILRVSPAATANRREADEKRDYIGSLQKAVQANSDRSGTTALWAFRLLLAGAGCFVIWHVMQMYSRGLVAPLNL